MGLGDCFSRSWDIARVILDEEHSEGMALDRPYAQVDRLKLKTKLMRAAHDSGCEFLKGKVSDVDHEERLSSVSVRGGAERYWARAVLVRDLPRLIRTSLPQITCAAWLLADERRRFLVLRELKE